MNREGRHCVRSCQKWKKGSTCLRQSLSSTKGLVAFVSGGGGRRSDSKVNGVPVHGISRAFPCHLETCLLTMQMGHCHKEPWYIYGPCKVDDTRENPQISSTGRNEGHCSKQWAAASSSNTDMGQVFCSWTVFPLGAKTICCKYLDI